METVGEALTVAWKEGGRMGMAVEEVERTAAGDPVAVGAVAVHCPVKMAAWMVALVGLADLVVETATGEKLEAN